MVLEYPAMHLDTSLVLAVVICLLPVAVALILIRRKRRKRRASSRSPFDELQRRPAGEALRLKLEQFDDCINEDCLYLVLSPVLMVTVLVVQHPKDWIAPVVFCMASVAAVTFFCGRLLKNVSKRDNYRLGFEGERFVGEELSRLMSVGFEIYHDVPFDGFNIDHVLVGSRGVFAVETKTRRKPLKGDGKKDYRVQFDGRFLQWPWGRDEHGVEQAKTNAKTLAGWLGSATGENVWVTPILTLPGWLVERKAPAENFYVLNPKELFKVCANGPEKLTGSQIQRICHQLNQKCRIAVA